MDKESQKYNEYFGMSEKDYWDKYKHIFNPHELLSEKLKKYNLISAQSDLSGNLWPYHYYIAKSRKAFNNSISVYKLNSDLIEKIQETSIDRMPDEAPKLYKQPFIIEPHKPNETLFGDVMAIIGFYDKPGKIKFYDYEAINYFNFLIYNRPIKDKEWHDYAFNFTDPEMKIDHNRRSRYLLSNLFQLRPFGERSFWDFDMVDYSYNIINPKNKCDNCSLEKKCTSKERVISLSQYHYCLDVFYNNLLSFVTVFSYMIEAENSPIKIDKTVEHSNYPVTKKGKVIVKSEDWIVKYMYLDKDRVAYKKNPDPIELDKEGLVLKPINVKSHLRRQACGAGHKDHKIIFIDNYVANKWVRGGDTKIIVDLKK